jgi:tetratricopeptide (TPR) repeat protein
VQMGNLRLAQKQFADAANSYQAALDRNPNSKDALRGLMSAYIAQKKADRAISAANAQIAKAPNNSGFYELLGTALFRIKKDLTGAEAAFQKSAELDKNNFNSIIKLGEVQVAGGSVDAAIATYLQALKDNPREVTLYLQLGDLYTSKQEWDKAKEAYQHVLAIKPQDALASGHLANMILRNGGDLDLAASLAETARRGMPMSPNAADSLGWVYYQKGAYNLAIRMFVEALKLGDKNHAPDDANIHYHLALAYEKTGQDLQARQQLERVLKIDPNAGDAGNVKKTLAQLKSGR